MGYLERLMGNQAEPGTNDFSALGVDIHSHLIPEIDDGMKNMEETLQSLKSFQEMGFRKVITTPHVNSSFHYNTREDILSGLEKVNTVLKNENLSIVIETAAEYMVDASFMELYGKEDLLTFGDKYILIELSTAFPPIHLRSVFFDLQSLGYKIVLAHVERYLYWYEHLEELVNIRNSGIYFQVNTLSFGGYYSLFIRLMAEKLAKNDMVDFLGSDAHNPAFAEEYRKCLKNKYVQKLLNSKSLLNPTL